MASSTTFQVGLAVGEGALGQLQALLEDMKLNPKRYVHFSLFGKKNKPYSQAETEPKE